MAKRIVRLSENRPDLPPPKREIAYRVLSCPLFKHMKHTDACTVLRAKGVCRMQCHGYFEFAAENEDAVSRVIDKYGLAIMDHRRRYGLPTDIDLVEYVMPAGEHLCKYCGKSFVHEGRYKKHLEAKHRRVIHEEKEQEKQREEAKAKRQALQHARDSVVRRHCNDNGKSRDLRVEGVKSGKPKRPIDSGSGRRGDKRVPVTIRKQGQKPRGKASSGSKSTQRTHVQKRGRR